MRIALFSECYLPTMNGVVTSLVTLRDGLRFHDGEPVRAVFIRAPWVEEVAPGVEVLATVGAGPAEGRIVAVRQGNLLATSFHPEITGDIRVHRLFVEMVRSSR